MIIVQVGTNNALDSCNKFAKENKDKIETIYLIEPLPNCIEDIKHNYTGVPNVNIFNLAISVDDPTGYDNTEQYVDLFFPELNVKSGHASFNKNHLIVHGHKKINSIKVPCLTLEAFFNKVKITKCDRLYIDTEGFDCEILLGFDFEKYGIKYIEFEVIHSDGPFKQTEKFNKCIQKFKNAGYEIQKSGKFNCIAIKS